MKIAIDLRSLSSGNMSGVENYTMNLLEHMLPMDHKNNYILFYNAAKARSFHQFNVVNSEIKATRVPNKILNLALRFGLKTIDEYTGVCDWFFMPNLNQFSLRSKTKLAITVHDLSPVVTPEFYNVKRRLWHYFLNYKKSFERASIIFAVSEYTKKELVRIFHVPEPKIKVIYPGVHMGPHVSESEKKLTRNKFELPGRYVLYVGTLEPRKNLLGLIKSFEDLDDPAHLVIVGRAGWKFNNIFQSIQKSKKRDKIHYKGVVTESEKRSIISLARMVVYPSFYEGFGFVPLEAMQCSVPVIAGAVTSMPEVCGDAALLVNPYSRAELTRGMVAVLQDYKLRERLIVKGNEQVKKFDWTITAQKVLKEMNNAQYYSVSH